MRILRESWLDSPRGTKVMLSDQELVLDYGWGNGYVIILKDHPYWGLHDDELPYINVHNGITFADTVNRFFDCLHPEREKELKDMVQSLPLEYKSGWVLGFDTMYLNDNLKNWSKERVEEETKKLEDLLKKV